MNPHHFDSLKKSVGKKKYFITATNTQRGKTFFTAGLTLWLSKKKINVTFMKPIESGVKNDLFSPHSDFENILNWSGVSVSDADKKLMQSYVFSDSCSPHLAAERDGVDYPCLAHIKNCAKKLLERYDVLLVEGAGGLMVPIDREKKIFMIDLIKDLGFEVILVSQSGLGAINDACLSIQALQNRNIVVAGFVLNDCIDEDGDDYIKKDNLDFIQDFTKVPCLGRMGFLKDINEKSLFNLFDDMDKLKNIFI